MRTLGGVLDRLPPTLAALVHSLRDREVLLYAGGLAFYGLISVVPFVVIAFWIAGAIVGADSLRELSDNVQDLSPGEGDVSGVVDSLATVGTGLGVGALLAALWPATAYGSGLVRAFDRISDRPERSFKGLRGRLRALLFIVLLPTFLISALGASYVATTVLDGGATSMIVEWMLSLTAGFVAGVVMLTIIYHLFGPDRLPIGAVVEGAAAASATIAVMSLLYVVYLGELADFQERVAGSGLASVVLLALWLYLANATLLVGYAFARSRAGRTADPDEDPSGDGRPGPEARHPQVSSWTSSATGSWTSVRR